jgi:hypothetical protein
MIMHCDRMIAGQPIWSYRGIPHLKMTELEMKAYAAMKIDVG